MAENDVLVGTIESPFVERPSRDKKAASTAVAMAEILSQSKSFQRHLGPFRMMPGVHALRLIPREVDLNVYRD